jgi:hypothetical protein
MRFLDSRWPGRVNSPSEGLRPRWRSAPRVLREVVTASSETPKVLSTTEPLATRTPYHPMVPSKTGFPRAGHFSVRRRASPFDSAFPKPVPTRSRIRFRHTVPSKTSGRGTSVSGDKMQHLIAPKAKMSAQRDKNSSGGRSADRPSRRGIHSPEIEKERAARQQFRPQDDRPTGHQDGVFIARNQVAGFIPPGTTSGSVLNQH